MMICYFHLLDHSTHWIFFFSEWKNKPRGQHFKRVEWKMSLKTEFPEEQHTPLQLQNSVQLHWECQVMLVKPWTELNRCGLVWANACLPLILPQWINCVCSQRLRQPSVGQLNHPNDSILFSQPHQHISASSVIQQCKSARASSGQVRGAASCLTSEMLSLGGSLLWTTKDNVDLPVFSADWKRRTTD